HYHVRVAEGHARRVLIDADDVEGERHQRKLRVEERQPAAAPGEARKRDREQPERQDEEEELDRPLAQVVDPDDREPGPGDERSERPRHRSELALPLVPAEELPRERERGRRYHAVAPPEEVRVRRPA